MSETGIWRGVPYEIDGDNVVLGKENQTFEMKSLDMTDPEYLFADVCNGKHLSTKGTVILPENCYYVFAASDLESFDAKGFDFSKVKNMDEMFAEDIYLEKVDFRGANTSNVTSMRGLFVSCEGLKNVDLTGIDTSSVEDMSEMFAYCENLESLDLSSFDTSNVKTFDDMFRECSFDTLDLSGFDTRNAESEFGVMFEDCDIKEIYIDRNTWRDNGRWLPNNVRTKEEFGRRHERESTFYGVPYIFEDGCLIIGKQGETYNLSTLSAKRGDHDMLRKETVKVVTKGRINIIHGDNMFADYKNLRFVDLSSMNTDKCVSLNHMLAGCTSLKEVDVSHMDFDSLSKENRYIEGFGDDPYGRDILTGGSGPRAIYVSDEYYRGLLNATKEHIGYLGEDFYSGGYLMEYGEDDVISEIMDKYHPVRELPEKEHTYDGHYDKVKRFQDLQSMLDSLTEERGLNTRDVDMDGPDFEM